MPALLIEDDRVIATALRGQAEAEGHCVDRAARLDDAREALATTGFDLILLDLMLPGGLGLPFLRDLRSRGNRTPVIIMTALDQVSDRIEGLNAGADDYLVKPFDLSELSARIGTVARRYSGNPNPRLAPGDMSIDLAERRVTRAGRTIPLTAREWVLFETFLQRPQQPMSCTPLQERLHSFDSEVESNTIEVHISAFARNRGQASSSPSAGVATAWGRDEQGLPPTTVGSAAVADRHADLAGHRAADRAASDHAPRRAWPLPAIRLPGQPLRLFSPVPGKTTGLSASIRLLGADAPSKDPT